MSYASEIAQISEIVETLGLNRKHMAALRFYCDLAKNKYQAIVRILEVTKNADGTVNLDIARKFISPRATAKFMRELMVYDTNNVLAHTFESKGIIEENISKFDAKDRGIDYVRIMYLKGKLN